MNPSSAPVYYVRSDTDRNHFYAVTTDERGCLKCECKSAQYRRTPCKHCRAVAAGNVRPATPKPQPAPVVKPARVPVAQHLVDELYGEPAPVRRGRDLVMGGLREPAL